MTRPIIEEASSSHTPESLCASIPDAGGLVVLLRTALFDSPSSRYSILAARPFLTMSSWGTRCRLTHSAGAFLRYGNPWIVMRDLVARYEVLDEVDLPFPIGGCFGFWGYDLKQFLEPKLPRAAADDLELPDCVLGFYDSLVVFDHVLAKQWIISTGVGVDGSRSARRASAKAAFWRRLLARPDPPVESPCPSAPTRERPPVRSSLSRTEFLRRIRRAQTYIRRGHIYQVNLAHRLCAPNPEGGWALFEKWLNHSPAPFAAYLRCPGFELSSASPELFLRVSGREVRTRPIKGTRPRSPDPDQDARLSYELQASAKEMAELVMITDLLRNDLGRVCEFGSIRVPELVRLERFAHVQHLVSTVEGRLRREVSHLDLLARCFPGGSITGAPKIRAMEIIDELEPITRGPYTGSIGYLGFNRESQLSILIRTAVCRDGTAWFHAGAGIVADSDPEFEYEETMAKARGFLEAMTLSSGTDVKPVMRRS